MRFDTGSSFGIFSLAFVLNSVEFSWQSGIPGLQGRPNVPTVPKSYPGRLPYRKVHCPKREDTTLYTIFRLRDRNSNELECTPDMILLALGHMIVGFIDDAKDGTPPIVGPILNYLSEEVVYDEIKEKSIRAGSKYLAARGVFEKVPEETLRIPYVNPFGLWSQKSSSPTRPSSPTLSRSDSESGPGSDFSDSDSNSSSFSSFSSSSSSTATSHGSPRGLSANSVRRMFGRLLNRNNSRSSNSSSSSLSSRSSSLFSTPSSSRASSPGRD